MMKKERAGGRSSCVSQSSINRAFFFLLFFCINKKKDWRASEKRLQEYLAHETTPPPYDPTVGLCPGPYTHVTPGE